GKENGVNILKSIDEGSFQMGTVGEPLAEGTKGAPHLGPERPRLYSDLSPEEKDRVSFYQNAEKVFKSRQNARSLETKCKMSGDKMQEVLRQNAGSLKTKHRKS
nr:hypothetical protein [Tanacetum cinerariifolium]